MNKAKFLKEIEEAGIDNIKSLTTVGTLPWGAKETITNTEFIREKVDYIDEVYDENLVHKHNDTIRIIDWLIIR